MKKLFSILPFLLFAVSAMASTAYCDAPSGHLGNADFGDRNACVKLTIVQSSEANFVDVTVAMNRDLSTTSKIDYVYVLYNGLPYTAGTDDNGDALDELTAHVNVGSAEAGNLMIQYSNPNWGGRWQIDLTDVDFTNRCIDPSADIPSEYCRTAFSSGNGACRISWETLDNGNVEITLFEPDGSVAAGTHFRGNGVNIARLTVGGEPAANYFTSNVNAASNVQTLSLIDPAVKPERGAKFAYPSSTVEYAVVADGNAWPSLAFNYTYGGICDALDAPTNVAVATNGTITFDAVANAETYEAHVFEGANEVYVGEVTNGGVIGYPVYVAKTLTVYVVAKSSAKADSEFSDAVIWNAAASPLPASVWCETAGVATTKNNWGDAHFTINTLPNGNVTIVVSSPDGTAARFRNAKGMNGTFKLDGHNSTFNTYFTGSKTSDDTFTLALVDPANRPAIGAIIDYSGQIECATSQNNDDWSNYDLLGYVYGTTCPTDVPVTGVTLNQTTASVPVNKTLTLVATVAPHNAANKTIIWSSSNDAIATVVDGVVTPQAVGGPVTITARTEDGDFTATCAVTVTAAKVTEPDALPVAPTYAAAKVRAIHSATYSVEANYGNWGGSQSFTKEAYGIKIVMNPGNGYCGLVDFPAINANTMEYLHADVWIEDDASLRFVPIVTGQGEHGVTANLTGGQWNAIDLALDAAGFANYNDWTNVFQLKIDQAAGLTFWINNVYFYTTSEDDVTKPVMTSASLESVSYMSAIINVAATDDRGVAKYVVKNGAAEMGKYTPAAGKITVTGLTDATAYTLSVYAEDAAENVSDNKVDVELTTLALPAAATAPNVAGKEYRSVYAPSLTNMLKHDFALANWGSAAGTKVDAKGYTFYHTTNNATVVWGENNAGGNAIVAADAYKGSKGGLDASAMEYMHVDIWADKDGCNSLVIVINDHNLGAAQTLNAGWNSLDIALSEFAATPDNNYLLDNVAWIKFVGLNNTNDVAITNVYFYRAASLKQHVFTAVDADYHTLYLDFDATVPAGVTAYAGVQEDNYLTLSPIAGAIPANTGVVLLPAAAGDYTFTEADAATAVTSDLEGVLEATPYATLGDVLIMGTVDGHAAFCQPNTAIETALPANRAYLPNAALLANVFIRIEGEGGGEITTSVESLQAVELNWDMPVYNVLGQRVAKGATGVLLQNGVKYFVK